MRDSGVTLDHLARVAVKNHRNGVDNPNAMFRKPLSLEAVLDSPIVCDPLRLYMLCSPNEGAAAVVLESRGDGMRIEAATLRSQLPGRVLGEHNPLSGTGLTTTSRARSSARGSRGVRNRRGRPRRSRLRGAPRHRFGARALHGEAGARQVENARVALCHTVGRGANACVVILRR